MDISPSTIVDSDRQDGPATHDRLRDRRSCCLVLSTARVGHRRLLEAHFL